MVAIRSTRRARWQIVFAVTVVAIGLILLIVGVADPRGEFRPWRSFFGPEEDGHWAALTIDGRTVSPFDFRVSIRDRHVVGGRDGCNDWAYAAARTDGGERMIESTMQYCPPTELMRAYRALANDARITLLPDGTLRLTARGHHALFARCRWRNVKESGPGWTSQVTRCEVD